MFNWMEVTIVPTLDSFHKVLKYEVLMKDMQEKKELERVAITDPLTGVYNRRIFDERMERLITGARRNGDYFNLSIFDIDDFKKINDNFGHDRGDEVLLKVVKKVNEVLKRFSDDIYRIGGDEFLITFYTVKKLDAEDILKSLKDGIVEINENLKLPNFNLSISIGAITYKEQTHLTKEELIKKADRNLYKAKEKKNKIVLTYISGVDKEENIELE